VIRCLRTEVDYVLPADPEAPSRACCHGNRLDAVMSSTQAMGGIAAALRSDDMCLGRSRIPRRPAAGSVGTYRTGSGFPRWANVYAKEAR
jgi:hypothetical protein